MHEIEPVPATSSRPSAAADARSGDAAPTPRSLAAAPAATPAPASGTANSDLWRLIQNAVRARVAPEQFATWFRRTTLDHVDEALVRLAVQNTFTREWIQSYYKAVIEAAIIEVLGSARTLEFVVNPELVLFNPVTTVNSPDAPNSTAPTSRSATRTASWLCRLNSTYAPPA